jgi:molybdate transport system ATP-binding protein
MEGVKQLLEIKIERFLPDFGLNVELTVNKEIISVLGPSGSGKTMTLFCTAGLVRPDRGFIKLNNRVLYNSQDKTFVPPRERKIGFVFQNFALFPHLTVFENIAYGLRDQPATKIKSKVTELLNVMHIPALNNRFPAELSSGQQQRVALARAIAPEPEALLLDEPFSALDNYRKERLEYELLALQQYYNGDILFVTHDLEQGYKVGTRIAIFDQGQIIQCAGKQEVVNAPTNRTAARLTGFKNLIKGKVASINANYLQVNVPEFNNTLQVNTSLTATFEINQPVLIGIKPENLVLRAKPAQNTVNCSFDNLVESVSALHLFFHANYDTEKRYSLENRTAKATAPAPYSTNSNCFIYFDPKKMIILPDCTGQSDQ